MDISTERETERDRETDKHTYRQTDRQTETERARQRETERETERDRQTNRQRGREGEGERERGKTCTGWVGSVDSVAAIKFDGSVGMTGLHPRIFVPIPRQGFPRRFCMYLS